MKLSDVGVLKFGNTVQLVGGVWAGEDKAYLCLFPEEAGRVFTALNDAGEEQAHLSQETGDPLEIVELSMDSEEWQQFLRQTDLMETEILAKDKSGGLVKAIARKSNRQIDQNVSWRVFKRDGYACRYCGKNDVPLTVDHLVRWEEGGPSIEANLLAACRKCNRTRGNQYYDDWLRSGYYKQVSLGLAPDVREANIAVAATLDAVPRKVHVHTR
jgi:hypothetical protein